MLYDKTTTVQLRGFVPTISDEHNQVSTMPLVCIALYMPSSQFDLCK